MVKRSAFVAWPGLACAGLRVERSGFHSMCCVLVQNTLPLQCPPPRSING